MVEHLVYTERVGGSSPSSPTTACPGLVAAHGDLTEAVRQWQAARERNAKFEIELHSDGTSTLTDTRASEMPVVRQVSAAETRLLSFLDEMQPVVRLVDEFAAAEDEAYVELGGKVGVEAALKKFSRDGTILLESGTALALPTRMQTANSSDSIAVRELVGAAQ